MDGFAGSGRVEDLGSMVSKRPLFDEFWESKRILPERIRDVPMYLTASYSCVFFSVVTMGVVANGLVVGLDFIVRDRSRRLNAHRLRGSG